MSNEEALAQRCQEGDRRAQQTLYETYAGLLYGMCLRYIGDQELAKDLLHDGFVQVLTHFDSFTWRGEGSLRAWLTSVQRNVILMYLRHERQVELVSMDDQPELLADVPEPDTVADIPPGELARLIAELPVGYRTVFNLYVIDGLSHREIAQQLGINEKSSASQLVHARRQLSAKIEAWRKENL